jgi:hypothetical protein
MRQEAESDGNAQGDKRRGRSGRAAAGGGGGGGGGGPYLRRVRQRVCAHWRQADDVQRVQEGSLLLCRLRCLALARRPPPLRMLTAKRCAGRLPARPPCLLTLLQLRGGVPAHQRQVSGLLSLQGAGLLGGVPGASLPACRLAPFHLHSTTHSRASQLADRVRRQSAHWPHSCEQGQRQAPAGPGFRFRRTSDGRVEIVSIAPGGPAEALASLAPGDVILSVGGRRCEDLGRASRVRDALLGPTVCVRPRPQGLVAIALAQVSACLDPTSCTSEERDRGGGRARRCASSCFAMAAGGRPT